MSYKSYLEPDDRDTPEYLFCKKLESYGSSFDGNLLSLTYDKKTRPIAVVGRRLYVFHKNDFRGASLDGSAVEQPETDPVTMSWAKVGPPKGYYILSSKAERNTLYAIVDGETIMIIKKDASYKGPTTQCWREKEKFEYAQDGK